MRNLVGNLVWVCLAWLLLGTAAHADAATPAKPLLDGMTAVQSSLGALVPKLGDGTVAAVNFDAVRDEWQIRFDRGQGAAPATLEIALDESTGKVCAHAPGVATCFAKGSVAALLKQVRDQRAAQAEAVQHPAPDLQGVMMALIRYQVTAKDGYLRANPMPLYVALSWPDNRRRLDLSADAIRQLADTGLNLFPGSAKPASTKNAVENTEMMMGVGLPVHRQDGDYDVNYDFYCGNLCASSHTAVLHRDAKGWHVVSSRMNSIS